MGMDAKSKVFYGFDEQFELDYETEDPWEALEDKLFRTGVYFVTSCDRMWLCVEASRQNFDWNEIQKLNTVPLQNADRKTWNDMLEKACKIVGLEWDIKNVGWFVVCDYR